MEAIVVIYLMRTLRWAHACKVPSTQWELYWWHVCAQSCLTLCNVIDCTPPGSSVHGILQARIMEWVAIPFSRVSSQPRDWTQVSRIAGRILTLWATTHGMCIDNSGPHCPGQCAKDKSHGHHDTVSASLPTVAWQSLRRLDQRFWNKNCEKNRIGFVIDHFGLEIHFSFAHLVIIG